MEKAQVRAFMQQPAWSAVVKFMDLKLSQWREMPISGVSAFEELRALHTRDGKVAGVLELFNEMEETVTA